MSARSSFGMLNLAFPQQRRPREGGDPYAQDFQLECDVATVVPEPRARWLWVTAFAGTTYGRHQVPPGTSSVHTVKLTSVFGPNVCVIGTSEASRPCAISTRPMRGMLLRASKVCQRPPI